MSMEIELSEWHFKLGSSTLEEIRLPATSAQLKHFLQIFLLSMDNGMVLKV
jgi:hypothetical protein